MLVCLMRSFSKKKLSYRGCIMWKKKEKDGEGVALKWRLGALVEVLQPCMKFSFLNVEKKLVFLCMDVMKCKHQRGVVLILKVRGVQVVITQTSTGGPGK
ncbi:hypothetical protein KSP39_PZI021497 [Platanthera zijinensis]|uniref:Uncharacterized protein n=1 Tax=Platanthera zijinensis TaxID=2320716 RepID=A0AAP0FWI8_9ASPA